MRSQYSFCWENSRNQFSIHVNGIALNEKHKVIQLSHTESSSSKSRKKLCMIDIG